MGEAQTFAANANALVLRQATRLVNHRALDPEVLRNVDTRNNAFWFGRLNREVYDALNAVILITKDEIG